MCEREREICIYDAGVVFVVEGGAVCFLIYISKSISYNENRR